MIGAERINISIGIAKGRGTTNIWAVSNSALPNLLVRSVLLNLRGKIAASYARVVLMLRISQRRLIRNIPLQKGLIWVNIASSVMGLVATSKVNLEPIR